MTDSMKFGPEWLRNMSNDMGSAGGGGGGSSSGSTGNNICVPVSSGNHFSGGGSNHNMFSSYSSTNSPGSGGGGGNIHNNNSLKNSPSVLSNQNPVLTSTNSLQQQQQQQQQQPKYQLAEFRYGREEMLSLFEKTIKIPDILPKFKKLFIDKIQCPLALTPGTDDELALGINSGLSSGGVGSGGGGICGTRTPWSLRSTSMSIGGGTSSSVRGGGGGGRGSSIDRGRGRGRGSYHSLGFQRSSSMYDEDTRGGGSSGGVGGSSGGGNGSRVNWGERNGGIVSGMSDPIEWNGSINSRKEFITRSSTLESWRKGGISRINDDDMHPSSSSSDIGWRGGVSPSNSGGGTSNTNSSGFSKWTRSQSWRTDETTTPTSNAGYNITDASTATIRSFSLNSTMGGATGIDKSMAEKTSVPLLLSSGTGGGGGSVILGNAKPKNLIRKQANSWDEDLPEWAIEETIESGGSFDSSGAFHGSEDENSNSILVSPSDNQLNNEDSTNNIIATKNNLQNTTTSSPSTIPVATSITSTTTTTTSSASSSTSEAATSSSSSSSLTTSTTAVSPTIPTTATTIIKNHTNNNMNTNHQSSANVNEDKSLSSAMPSSNNNNNNNNTDIKLSSKMEYGTIRENVNLSDSLLMNNDDNLLTAVSAAIPTTVVTVHNPTFVDNKNNDNNLNTNTLTNVVPSPSSTYSVDRMKEVADDIEKLIKDDEHGSSDIKLLSSNRMNPNQCEQLALPQLMLSNDVLVQQQQQQQQQLQNISPAISSSTSQLQQIVGGSSGVTGGAGSGSGPINNELWFYRDPQGKVQGPFSAVEMAEWYRAGYFDENLFVRRVCDSRYAALGDLVRLCGGTIPFSTTHSIPPLQQLNQLISPNSISNGEIINVSNTKTDLPIPIPGPVIGNPIIMPQSTIGNQHKSATNQQQQQQQIDPDVASALNYQLHVIQKQYLIRQQALLQKLSATEPWELLTPKQQNQLVNQHMAHMSLPDHLLQPPNVNHAAVVAAAAAASQQKFGVVPGVSGVGIETNVTSVGGVSGGGGSNSSTNSKPTTPSQMHPINTSQKLPITKPIIKQPNLMYQDYSQNIVSSQSSTTSLPPPSSSSVSASSAPPSTSIITTPTSNTAAIQQLIHSLSMNQTQHQSVESSSSSTSNNNILEQHHHHHQQHQQQHHHHLHPHPHLPHPHAHPHPHPVTQQSNLPKHDPIKSLFMQLSMQQNESLSHHPQHQMEQKDGSGWMGTSAPNQSQQQSSSNLLQHGMWDIPVAQLNKHHPAEMKTESQILEEQLAQHQKTHYQIQQQQQQQQHHLQQQQLQQLQQQQQHEPAKIIKDNLLEDEFASTMWKLNKQTLQSQQQLQQAASAAAAAQQQKEINRRDHLNLQHEFDGKQTNEEEKQKILLQQQQPQQQQQPPTTRKEFNKKDNNTFLNNSSSSTTNACKIDETLVQQHNNHPQQQQPNQKRREDDRKKGKELKKQQQQQQQLEEERRRQADDEKRRQFSEDKKRMEIIAAASDQRKIKNLDGQQSATRISSSSTPVVATTASSAATASATVIGNNNNNNNNNSNVSIAPWSQLSSAGENGSNNSSFVYNVPPCLAEIQKAERERRAEHARIEQAIREQQIAQSLLDNQQKNETTLKWNLKPQTVKSLAEIQAEESKQQQQQQMHNVGISGIMNTNINLNKKQQFDQSNIYQNNATNKPFTSIWNNSDIMSTGNAEGGVTTQQSMWNSSKMWINGTSNGSSGGAGGGIGTGGGGNNNLSINNSSGFWEEPVVKTSTGGGSSGALSNITTSAASATISSSLSASSAQTSASTALTLNNSSKSINHSSVTKSNLVKSQTVSNIHQTPTSVINQQMAKQQSKPISKANSSANISIGGLSNSISSGKSIKKKDRNDGNGGDQSNNEFNAWCSKALSTYVDVIDVPTFIAFLRDIESPFEVKEYFRMYLGETKECMEFAKQYLERRSRYKNQQRAANAHIDDMCQPAPAITPSNDFQEVKGKGKKEKKKNKMQKIDSRILGFSVTAAQDRLNVGDRDYGDAP